MITTHYEVYVQDRGRSWALHARFPSEEREAAISEAKDMERNGFRARVSRESYNNEDNSYDDADIYISPPKAVAAAIEAGSGPAARSGGGTAQSTARPGGGKLAGKPRPAGAFRARPTMKSNFDAREKAKEAGEAIRSILHSKGAMYIVILSMLGVAAGTAMVVAMPYLLTWAWQHGMPLNLTAQGYDTLMVGAFAGAFLVVAVPLGISFLPRIIQSKDDDEPESPEMARIRQVESQRQTKLRQSLDSLSRSALIAEEKEQAAEEAEQSTEAAPPSPPPPPEIKDEPTFRKEPDEAPSPESPRTEEPPAPPEPAGGPESTAKAEAGVKMKQFIDSAVAAVKTTHTQLDAYNKFALHLYVAGAVDSIADVKGLVLLF